MYHVPPHLKYVALLLWEMLELYFYAILQKMLLINVSRVLKIRLNVLCHMAE